MTESPKQSEQPAANPAPASAAAPAGALPSPELAAARKEAADNYNRYVRAMADLENFRRRAVREKEELRLFALTGVLQDLLPVLDNLSLAINAARQPNAELKVLAGGIDLALQQFKGVLGSHGLAEINPAGKPFDPHQHEAISHQPSPDVPAEHVMAVVRTGYSLNGRLVRPAAVIVSNGPPPAP